MDDMMCAKRRLVITIHSLFRNKTMINHIIWISNIISERRINRLEMSVYFKRHNCKRDLSMVVTYN